MKWFCVSLIVALLCVGSPAHAVGTGGSITCPSSSTYYPSGSFPVAIQWYADGSSWRFGTYEIFSNLGYTENVFGQFYNTLGNPTATCFDATPSGYGGFAGWIVDNSWQASNVADWMTFNTYDGSSWASTDKGVNWTQTNCANTGAGAPSCPTAPTTTTSCYHYLFGGTTYLPLTCPVGQFCSYAGLRQGHTMGACYTACTGMYGWSNCSCVAEVDKDSGGHCPNGWVNEINDGHCILDHSSSGMCYAP